MQYCPKCKVNIRGEKVCCPLCQGKIKEVDDNINDPFPTIRKKKISNITFFKVVTFIFIASEIIFWTVNYQTKNQYPFIGITMLGILVAWITVLTTMYLRNNLIKVITWEVVVAIVVDIYIDQKTGWHGWSVEWMVPATLTGLALATFITAKIVKLRLDEYVLFLVIDFIMALLQIIFIRNGMNTFTWPAVISIMVYVIMLVGLFIFRFRDLKIASERRFNM